MEIYVVFSRATYPCSPSSLLEGRNIFCEGGGVDPSQRRAEASEGNTDKGETSGEIDGKINLRFSSTLVMDCRL